MKRAILWCGQVEKGRIPQPDYNDKRLTNKEKLLVSNSPETLFPVDDFSLQANGLELAYQAARGLGVAEAEIYACLVQADLQPQNLKTEIRRATRDELERLIREISERSDATDTLLFIAVNHGSSDGLATAEDVTDPMREDVDTILTPERLQASLDILDGPQVLVLATCHAGVFLTLGRDNRRVLAACGADERYFVPRSDNICSPFLDELFGAWCGYAQNDAVPRAKLALDDAFARAKERMSIVGGLSIPQSQGTVIWPAHESENSVPRKNRRQT